MTTAAAALSMVLTAAGVAWTMKNDVHCGGAAAAAAMQVAWPTEASCQGGWGEAGGDAVDGRGSEEDDDDARSATWCVLQARPLTHAEAGRGACPCGLCCCCLAT